MSERSGQFFHGRILVMQAAHSAITTCKTRCTPCRSKRKEQSAIRVISGATLLTCASSLVPTFREQQRADAPQGMRGVFLVTSIPFRGCYQSMSTLVRIRIGPQGLGEYPDNSAYAEDCSASCARCSSPQRH